jgi:hypothetical protein
MDQDAFKSALRSLGLPPFANRTSAFLGLSERQIARILSGQYPAPKAIELLLRVMVAEHIKPEDFE